MKKIREREEHKNSRVEELKVKSQAAMEYLMTYGWAILIIALSLVVLYSLGIMNPKNFIPRAPPGSCFVFRPNGPGTTDYVSLQGTCGYLPMYVASFNGVSSYISVPDSVSLNPKNISVELWFKASNTGNREFVEKRTSSNAGGFGIQGDISGSSKIEGWIYDSGSWYATRGIQTITPQYNVWHQVILTYDGSYLRVYIDAKLDAQVAHSGSISSTTAPVRIGLSNTGLYPINGSIANVQIYNTALTPQEIQYLYQEGLGGGPVRLQNLVAWWPLNGDAKDYSGNNNHGTIYNVTFVQNYNPP